MARPASLKMSAIVLALAATAGLGSAALAAPVKGHGGPHAHHAAHHHHHHRHHLIVHRANRAAEAGDRHVAHPETVHKAALGAPVFELPPPPTPYPYDGRLAGDGILHTGILDTNVMRAFGMVPN